MKHSGQSRFSGGSPGLPRFCISFAWSNALTRQEQRRGDDQERHDRGDERAVEDRSVAELEREVVEGRLAEDRADDVQDDAVHQRIDDLLEVEAEDEGDRELEHVALERELLELPQESLSRDSITTTPPVGEPRLLVRRETMRPRRGSRRVWSGTYRVVPTDPVIARFPPQRASVAAARQFVTDTLIAAGRDERPRRSAAARQ